ncbi:signal transduction histidine kinase [Luteimonas cucumeris]|uniref:Signal transduction histidine kinase n=1 Tax=Luteimonas cucumeris TaxID=985012 RepID=A0A562LAN6_9GAMM|nr:sensor histidine kinase [Luteimonas cucumeris]TWI04723.1 signal transduction histidine kinase [Luteimonas cucumeris]
MPTSRFALLLIVFAGLVPTSPGVAAQAPETRFQPMGQSRTFQAEVITEVLQDRAGFLWIGTREGLYLHDGQRFRKFEYDLQNPAAISSNAIRAIHEDSRERLWIATISGGLNLLDRADWSFRNWRHGAPESGGPSHDGVFALADADDGRLWVGTQAGLDRFDPDSGRFERKPLGKGGEFVMSLHRDRKGRLWVGTLGHGLFRQQGEGFVAVVRGEHGADAPKDVFSIAEDAAGRVWVGARDGLYYVDPASGRLRAPSLAPAALADALLNVTELKRAPDGALWAGTFGVGLYRVDVAQGRIEAVPLGVAGSGGQHVDQGAIAFDRDGSLIVGTFGGGLLKTALDTLAVSTWGERRDDAPGLSTSDVYVLRPDGADGLWIGSFGGGVDHLSVASGVITPLALPVDKDLADRIGGVLDLLRSDDGMLWVATSQGMYRYRPSSDEFRHYPARDNVAGDRNPGYVYALLQDRAGRIWAGSGGAGLYRYRPQQDDFLVYRPVAGDPHSLSDDFVTALMEDRRGRLWVGTRSGGANLCLVGGERLDCEQLASGNDARSLSHYHVSAFLEAPDGSIWIGTTGGGLDRATLDAQGRIASVRRWSRADGLVDDNVVALAYAPDGALWISTRGGLSRLDKDLRGFENFTAGNGLPPGVFNPKAVAWLDGRLYWGSTRGVMAFDPLQRPQRRPPPQTLVTAISGLPPASRPDVPTWKLRQLEVPWRHPFSLELAVLGYDGGVNEYEYRLGASEPWIGLGDRGQLTLHALSPGRYELQVRGRRAGSAWTSAPSLQLHIVPPWWRQPWMLAAAIALLFALLLGGFLWRMRGLQRRNRELQRIQAQREQALEAARQSRDQLQEAFASLRRLTMRLEAAKEEERKHISRELHDEFGQALTAAKINLSLALGQADAIAAGERIGETIQMVDRMIAQVRALSLDLRPPLLDELGLAPALEGYLHAVSQRSGMPVEIALAPDLPAMDVEREIMVFRVVQEAVTNALRHAGACTIRVALDRTADGIRIEVRDDGRGFVMPQATVAGRVGNASGDGGPGATEPGFGLFGMRERVHDLGGRLTLRSAPGQGTVVSASVPIGQGDGDATRAG